MHIKDAVSYELKLLANLKRAYEKEKEKTSPDQEKLKQLSMAIARIQIYYEMKGYEAFYNYLTEKGITPEKIEQLANEAFIRAEQTRDENEELLGTTLHQIAGFMKKWSTEENQRALVVANNLANAEKGHYIVDTISRALQEGYTPEAETIESVKVYIATLPKAKKYLAMETAPKGTDITFGRSIAPSASELFINLRLVDGEAITQETVGRFKAALDGIRGPNPETIVVIIAKDEAQRKYLITPGLLPLGEDLKVELLRGKAWLDYISIKDAFGTGDFKVIRGNKVPENSDLKAALIGV